MAATLKRILIFSVAARGWAALLGLLAVPLYVDVIGIERYGFVGLFMTVQALCAFFDCGLGYTLTRSLATLAVDDPGGRNAHDTVRTFEVLMAGVGFAILLAICGGGFWFVSTWVGPHNLDGQEVFQATMLGGLAVFCIWPSSLYSMGLAGRQRLQQLSVALIATSSMRVLMTVLAIHLQPTLPAFFVAQAMGGALQSLVLRTLLWRSMEAVGRPARFDFKLASRHASFTAGMTVIGLCGILLTQMDKVVLSRMLSLSDFGYYSLAATIATGLYIFISPVFSALYPRFLAMSVHPNSMGLSDLYHASSQLLAVLIFPVGAVLGFFAQDVLFLWTGDGEASQRGAAILSVLAVGTCINGMMNIPYALQIANGWTSLAMMINVGSIFFIVPVSIAGAASYGGVGASGAWLALNFLFLVFWPYLMHRRLLKGELQAWYRHSILTPFAVVVIGSILLEWALQSVPRTRPILMLTLPSIWMLLTASCALGLPRARGHIAQWFFSSARP